MKLLFVADHLKPGGAERHLAALACGLAARGHQVMLAYLKASEGLAGELRRGGVQCILCCDARGGLDLAALARLGALVEAARPALLVATSQYSLMFAALAVRRAARRPALAFICHSMGVVRRGARARLRFLVYRQFYRLADCVVFVSALQRDYFAALGIRPARAEVVHNGVDLAHFAPDRVADGARALRARLAFRPDDLVVGLCALFREEKRQADLMAALALLRGRGLPVKALLVGDGPLRPQLEACRARLDLGGSVVLAGMQHDVRPYIALCDVMALTSHSETFPIATLEYMALARPLVASDVGGLREQVRHGHNGLLYPAGDIDALAAALARLADPALRAQLGQRALDTVRQRFDLRHMLARYEALFTALAGR